MKSGPRQRGSEGRRGVCFQGGTRGRILVVTPPVLAQEVPSGSGNQVMEAAGTLPRLKIKHVCPLALKSRWGGVWGPYQSGYWVLNVFVEQPEVKGSSLQPRLAARADPGPSIKAVGRRTGSSSGQPTVQDEVPRGAPCSSRPFPGQWDLQVGIRHPGRGRGSHAPALGGCLLVFHLCPRPCCGFPGESCLCVWDLSFKVCPAAAGVMSSNAGSDGQPGK